MKKFELPFILNLEGEWHIQDYIEDIVKKAIIFKENKRNYWI